MNNKIEITVGKHSYAMEENYRKFEEGKNYYFYDKGQNYYRTPFTVLGRDEDNHKVKILIDDVERTLSIDYWDSTKEMLYIRDDKGFEILHGIPFEVFDIEKHTGENKTYDYLLKNKDDIIKQLIQLLKNNSFADCWYALKMDKDGKLSLERYWQSNNLIIIHGKFYNNSLNTMTNEQICETIFEKVLESVYTYNKEVL